MGRRPAVVVQANSTDASLGTTMVVPMTSRLTALRWPHTIQVDPTPQNGLSVPSVLLVFQLRNIDKRRLNTQLGRLEPHYLQQVDQEIKSLLAL